MVLILSFNEFMHLHDLGQKLAGLLRQLSMRSSRVLCRCNLLGHVQEVVLRGLWGQTLLGHLLLELAGEDPLRLLPQLLDAALHAVVRQQALQALVVVQQVAVGLRDLHGDHLGELAVIIISFILNTRAILQLGMKLALEQVAPRYLLAD